MSEPTTPTRRDRGMTLPELLISIAVIGLVSSVLITGISVTLRQHEDTRGRVDVARWEQNLGMWLPDDLRSASDANAEPNATPCGASTCGGTDMSAGSNVLWLSWNEGGVTTRVSYRFQPDGDGFGLFRVACVGGDCSTLRVLSDLSAPPTSWAPGQPPPADIIEVGLPTADPSAPPQPRSVVVTVNGVPAIDGVSRSSKVSVAAGSTPLSSLPPAEFVGPSFVEAASDCGGPITLIVDSSGSIGSQMGAVRAGVEQFVRVFDGTPTRLQIVDFDDRARVLNPFGGPTPWNVYVDMSEPGNADLLIGSLGAISQGGWTNWEDAFNRAFFSEGGTPLAQVGNSATPAPEMVVFFTDGLPTRDRRQMRSGAASTLPGNPPGTTFDATGDWFSPRAWWRTDQILGSPSLGSARLGTRLIGLGVGPSFGGASNVGGWPQNPYPHEKFLGDVIVGGDVTDKTTTSYIRRTYTAADGWGDVSTANVLVASDFTKFSEALEDIALAECGGTLTVQTRTTSGATAPFNLRYTSGAEQVTTSRIAKSGTFDINLAGESSSTIQLIPSVTDLGASGGFTAQSWSCRSRGADLPFTQLDPSDPAAGIELTVQANGAVACTLTVAK